LEALKNKADTVKELPPEEPIVERKPRKENRHERRR
jgi:hypothetical protein